MTTRALFLAPIYRPVMGGAAIHFEQLATGLRERGAIDQAIVLTCFASLTQLVTREDDVIVLRLLVPPGRITTANRYVTLGYNYVVVAALTGLLVGVGGVDVVHTQTKRYYEWGCAVASRLRATVIVDGRDLGSVEFDATGDVFVAASRNVESAAKHRSERVIRIPVGVERTEFPERDRAVRPVEDEYLLYVGDVAVRKGVDTLLEAYERLDSEYPLVIVGEVIDADLLEKIRQTGGVVHVGTVTHETAIQYIANAELVVLPSREEALPRVPLEAFIVGTPVICPSMVPEFQDHVPHLVLSEVTSEHLRAKIEDVLEGGTVDMTYPVEQHYVEHTLEEYVALYDQYVHGRDSPTRA